MFTTIVFQRLGTFFGLSALVEGGLTGMSFLNWKSNAVIISIGIILVVSTRISNCARDYVFVLTCEWLLSMAVVCIALQWFLENCMHWMHLDRKNEGIITIMINCFAFFLMTYSKFPKCAIGSRKVRAGRRLKKCKQLTVHKNMMASIRNNSNDCTCHSKSNY